MLLQALHVEIEMQNVNLQVTLLVQRCGNAVPTRSYPTTLLLAGLTPISSHLQHRL